MIISGLSCLRAVLLALVGLGGLFGAVPAQAWNPTGHMLIASMAYNQLSPADQAHYTDLLKLHPDFPKWEAAAPKTQLDFDLGRYLFSRASTWPDDIRKSGSPYDHPVWHYVDYPLEGSGFPQEPAPKDTEDILFGIARCRIVLADPQAAGSEKAAHLSWLIHLVGDLQQPLHCAALISPDYPRPVGDRGGNSFYVLVGGMPISLHWLWDCLPGSSTDGKELIDQGKKLEARFPREALPELTQARDPQAWSLEGRTLCLEHVYKHGALLGGKQAGPDDPRLPDGYYAEAHALAERRVALAAYRLADTLAALPQAPSSR